MISQSLLQKLSNDCTIFRDDGVSSGDYREQLRFLLLLKMADEQSRPPFSQPSPLLKRDDDELEIHYRQKLKALGQQLGLISVMRCRYATDNNAGAGQ